MTELGSRAPHQTAEELQAEALVARAEAQYERRFVEGEQVARDEGLREELVAVRRELNELSDAGSNVRRRSAYAAGLAALLLEGLERWMALVNSLHCSQMASHFCDSCFDGILMEAAVDTVSPSVDSLAQCLCEDRAADSGEAGSRSCGRLERARSLLLGGRRPPSRLELL